MSSSMYLQMSLEARPLVTAMVEDTTVWLRSPKMYYNNMDTYIRKVERNWRES